MKPSRPRVSRRIDISSLTANKWVQKALDTVVEWCVNNALTAVALVFTIALIYILILLGLPDERVRWVREFVGIPQTAQPVPQSPPNGEVPNPLTSDGPSIRPTSPVTVVPLPKNDRTSQSGEAPEKNTPDPPVPRMPSSREGVGEFVQPSDARQP